MTQSPPPAPRLSPAAQPSSGTCPSRPPSSLPGGALLLPAYYTFPPWLAQIPHPCPLSLHYHREPHPSYHREPCVYSAGSLRVGRIRPSNPSPSERRQACR